MGKKKGAWYGRFSGKDDKVASIGFMVLAVALVVIQDLRYRFKFRSTLLSGVLFLYDIRMRREKILGIEETIQTILEDNEDVSGGEELSKKTGEEIFPKEIKDALSILIKEKRHFENRRKGKYASLASKGYYKGPLEVKRGRFGFVRAEGEISLFLRGI